MNNLPEPTLEYRKPSELRTHPSQHKHFGKRSPEALDELDEIMARNDRFDPIDITPEGVILSGHQRKRVAEKRNMPVVPVRVRHDLAALGPEAEEQFFLDENQAGRQLTKLEQLKVYVRTKELEELRGKKEGRRGGKGGGRLRDAIAARFGKSGRSMEDLLPILLAPIEVQKAFEKRQLSGQEAKRIAASTTEQQSEIVKLIDEGMSPRDAMFEVLGARKAAPPTPKQLTRLWRQLGSSAVVLLQTFPQCIEDLPRKRRRLQLVADLVDRIREIGLLDQKANENQSQNGLKQKPKLFPRTKSDGPHKPKPKAETPQKPKLLPKPTSPSKSAPVARPKLLPRAVSRPNGDETLSSAS